MVPVAKVSRAACQLAPAPIFAVIIRQRAIVHHHRDVREHTLSGLVIGICVQEDGQTVEVVFAPKHRPWYKAVSGVPQGDAVSMEILLPGTMDFEVDMHFPVLKEAWLVVPNRALFAALVRGQTHVLARKHRAALEVPERHGTGTDSLVGLDERVLPLEVFTVAVGYIRSHQPQQQKKM